MYTYMYVVKRGRRRGQGENTKQGGRGPHGANTCAGKKVKTHEPEDERDATERPSSLQRPVCSR